MHVRIIQAGDDRAATAVDYIRRRPTLPQDFIIRSDSTDFAVFNSKRLGKRRHSVRRDSRVVQYTVGLHAWLLIALSYGTLHLKSSFVCTRRRRYYILRKLCRRRTVDHRVGVLNAGS